MADGGGTVRAIPIVALVLSASLLCSCSAGFKKTRALYRADHDFKAGDYDRARIEYLNVLRLDHGNHTAINRLGVIYFEGGSPVRAFQFLKAARDSDPNDFGIRAKLVTALFNVGERTEARKEAVALLRQDPGDSDAILVLADSVRTEQEVNESEQQLRELRIPEGASLHLARASLALRKNDLATVEKELQQAVALEPKSAIAHMALGNFRSLQKDLPQAGLEFKMAAELAPVRSIERLKYAEFQAATGAVNDARANLKEMTRKAPDYLPAWLLLAQMSINEKKLDEALALLENVFSRDAQNISARLLQAQTQMAKGENKKTVEGLQGLSKTYPNVPGIEFQLARAYLQNNDPNPAIAELNKAVAAQPDYLEAVLLLAQTNLRAGEAEAAITPMVELLKKRPHFAPAQSFLAEAYRSLGRLDEAAGILREQIEAAPNSPDAYFMLGLVLTQEHRASEAREAFQKTLELSPDNLLSIDQLVSLDIADKNFQDAMQRVQAQIRRTPQAASLFLIEAKVYIGQANWDGAETALQKALELEPTYAAASELLISTYVAANKLPEAIRQLEIYLSKKPDDAQALMTLAVIYDKQKEVTKARDIYEKLLAKNPDLIAGLNNLAYLYVEELNQPEKAYPLARKAHEIQPADPSVADTLGWVLYKRGDYQQAQALFEESAAKQTQSPDVHYHLGMASYMMGQNEKAEAAFHQALKGPADFAGKQEALRCLALLGDAGTGQLPREQLAAMVQQQPNDPIARTRLGEAYEREKNFPQAAAEYEKALQLNSKLLSPLMSLARLYAGPLQNNAQALTDAKKARELAPADPRIAGVLGEIAYRAGNFVWAQSLLQESVRQLSDDPTILHDYAWATYSLGNVDQARAFMERALKANSPPDISKDASSFLSMTTVDRDPKRAEAMESEIEKLLQADPRYVPALAARGSLEVHRGDLRQAVGTYSEILQRFPDFAPAEKQLALLYLEEPASLEKAYGLAVKARKALPNDPELIRTLGEISYRRKEYPRAVQLLRESAQTAPLDAKGFYYLGASQLQMEQKAEGKQSLERALSSALPEPLASDARRLLGRPSGN
jgi:tetratricopeptide (TPR) repeat protein